MALTLRSTTSVQRSDKISAVLDRIITPGTDAAEKQFRESKAVQRSEYESYMEKEAWTRMKTDRDKDMVLMFGDDDVRVFKRNPANQLASRKLRRSGNLAKADLADVSGLVPVQLDASVMKVVTSGEYVPYSQEERARIQQRKQEIALRRQQLANQYVFVSQNAGHASSPGQQYSAYAQQMAELGVHLPNDTSHGEEPSAIPLKAWQTWIPRRQDTTKDGADAATQQLRNKRRQRRHHRLNCKYHPFSTNSEMRRLAIQSSFPRSALLNSIDRVQHAANGAANGEGRRFDIEDCFAPVEFVGLHRKEKNERSQSSLPTAIDHSVSTSAGASGFGVGAARSLRRSMTPNTSDTNAPLPSLALADGVQNVDISDLTASSARGAFMTEADTTRRSALERVTVPSLQPFERPPRPHTSEGVFIDCVCTPRLTDDELDMFGFREEFDSPPGSDAGDPGSPSSRAGAAKGKKKRTTLLGSAARAQKRLDLWHRDFVMATVHSGSGLQSLLDEREENRTFVTAEREHLNLVTREAELSGADFRVSRRHRCTTPQRASMWTPVFDAIGDDARHVVQNATSFASLMDLCEELQFPAEAWERALLLEVRQRCVENASIRQRQPTSSPANTPERKRQGTPSTGSRPPSQISTQRPRTEDRRRSSATAVPPPAVSQGSSYASPSAGGEKSVFVANTKKPTSSAASGGGQRHAVSDTAFNEAFAQHVLETYGSNLFRTKRCTEVANFFRELCNMPNKTFLAFLFSKESVWEYCQEVHNLQKRLASAAK